MRRLALLPLALSLATVAGAQAAAKPPGCYGFAFGRWHPALDLAAAGHDPAATGLPGAPNGRGWAANDGAGRPAGAAGAELMLLPPWWPAGVRLTAARLPGVGDTVKASAVALVANGTATPPTAQALVWGVPCDRAAQTRPAWADSTTDSRTPPVARDSGRGHVARSPTSHPRAAPTSPR